MQSNLGKAEFEKSNTKSDATVIKSDSDKSKKIINKSKKSSEDQLFNNKLVVKADIYSRLGKCDKSQIIYEKLLKKHPQFPDLWINYIDALLQCDSNNKALITVEAFLKLHENNKFGVRLLGQIYKILGFYKSAQTTFEKIIPYYQNDAALWIEYGAVQKAQGNWIDALNSFSRALEIRDDHEVLREIHGLLKEYKSKIYTGFNTRRTDYDLVNSYEFGFGKQLTQKNRLYFDFQYLYIDRPGNTYFSPFTKEIETGLLSLDYNHNPQLNLKLGLGYSTLDKKDMVVNSIFKYKITDEYSLGARLDVNQLWYDPVDGTIYNGQINSGLLSFDRHFNRLWYLYLDYSYKEYFTNNVDFGKSSSFTALISHRITKRPDVKIMASYVGQRFRYANADNKVIYMVPIEDLFSLGVNGYFHINKNFSLYMSLSSRRDNTRDLTAFDVLSTLDYKIGKRVTGQLLYNYSSDARTVIGGRVETFNFVLKIIL